MSALPAQTSAPAPVEITLHARSRVLELAFADGERFRLDAEYLRVMSPSAEVKGHGPGQEILQTGKCEVGITAVEPIGHYALKPLFDDGHESGLFTWDYLYWLGKHREPIWADYLARLEAAGRRREPALKVASSSGPAAPAFDAIELPRG